MSDSLSLVCCCFVCLFVRACVCMLSHFISNLLLCGCHLTLNLLEMIAKWSEWLFNASTTCVHCQAQPFRLDIRSFIIYSSFVSLSKRPGKLKASYINFVMSVISVGPS